MQGAVACLFHMFLLEIILQNQNQSMFPCHSYDYDVYHWRMLV